MTTPQTHTLDDLAALERSTGLQLYGWLSVPPVLLPILGRPGLTLAQRRALVLKLNRAGMPVTPDPPPRPSRPPEAQPMLTYADIGAENSRNCCGICRRNAAQARSCKRR